MGCSSFLGCYMVVDTGTSILAGPPASMNKLIAAVGTVEKDCSNVDKLPTVREHNWNRLETPSAPPSAP